MNLVAVLIVRNEAANLPGCLSSLRGIVDGVHVHDTGSSDETVDLARSLGATVSTGEWRDDFAAARNAAVQAAIQAAAGAAAQAAGVTVQAAIQAVQAANQSVAGVAAQAANQAVQAAEGPEWVLSIDADDRAEGDPRRLRAILASARSGALLVPIDNRHDELPYTHHTPRLFRPARVHWEGRVHERLVPADGVWPALPREALHFVHHGYADAETRRRKALRNAAIGEEVLEQLSGEADRDLAATTLLDLGRSYVGAGRAQEAVNAFEHLRERTRPGDRQWVLGTDALARLLLGAGHDDAVVFLARELREQGAERQYCDWLEAQALAQLGHADEAWRLLSGVKHVVDPAGRVYPPGHLAELKRLLGELVAARR
ncbi:glycosyltransferase [Dactylosporangium sp. NPDC000244]|uniref:glycosyltransferase n=1 Tax=Dactylosporangium sp. NPDC000244 TaxID=3154365 RepID=UPI003333B46D